MARNVAGTLLPGQTTDRIMDGDGMEMPTPPNFA